VVEPVLVPARLERGGLVFLREIGLRVVHEPVRIPETMPPVKKTDVSGESTSRLHAGSPRAWRTRTQGLGLFSRAVFRPRLREASHGRASSGPRRRGPIAACRG